MGGQQRLRLFGGMSRRSNQSTKTATQTARRRKSMDSFDELAFLELLGDPHKTLDAAFMEFHSLVRNPQEKKSKKPQAERILWMLVSAYHAHRVVPMRQLWKSEVLFEGHKNRPLPYSAPPWLRLDVSNLYFFGKELTLPTQKIVGRDAKTAVDIARTYYSMELARLILRNASRRPSKADLMEIVGSVLGLSNDAVEKQLEKCNGVKGKPGEFSFLKGKNPVLCSLLFCVPFHLVASKCKNFAKLRRSLNG